ncbi:MAG: malectin domain-containing carbohydrate-binding protein, partial [Dehalococcoidia bacterium]
EDTPEPTASPDSDDAEGTTVASTDPAPSALASVPLYVNVGGQEFQDRQGHQWQADQEYSGANGWGYMSGGDEAEFRYEYHGGVGHFPHSSGREGMTAYRFNVPDDGSFYAVTLDFTGRLEEVDGYGERVFYVTVGETVPGVQEAAVVGPIDPWTAFHSNYVSNRYRVEYMRPVDGVIEVTFNAVAGEPVINGIIIERQ